MSKQDFINQGKVVFESIKSIDKTNVTANPGNLQPWSNMDFDDFVLSFEEMLKTLDAVYSNDVLMYSTHNIINSLNSTLNNVHQHLNQYVANKAQAQFQNAFSQIESLRTNMQTWGLKYEAILGKEIEEKSRLIDEEITNLLSKKAEINALKDSVDSLIEPAVAGSLSKSFSERKDSLHKNQDRWFWSSVVMAAVAVISTIIIVGSIVGVFSSEEVLKAIGSSENGINGIVWSTIGLRIGILLPIYSIFIFCFLQYKKERDLEEEYAHKAAVATSLPNYGGLAVEDGVKDQILSEASKVIFASPSSESSKNESNTGSSDLKSVNDILGNIQKLVQKSQS